MIYMNSIMEELQKALQIAMQSGDLSKETMVAMMPHAKKAADQITIMNTISEVME